LAIRQRADASERPAAIHLYAIGGSGWRTIIDAIRKRIHIAHNLRRICDLPIVQLVRNTALRIGAASEAESGNKCRECYGFTKLLSHGVPLKT
jgi:hypothetical protein